MRCFNEKMHEQTENSLEPSLKTIYNQKKFLFWINSIVRMRGRKRPTNIYRMRLIEIV